MPRVQNVSLGGGQAALFKKVTNVSSAQILTLSSTPVVIVPAPGAGNIAVLYYATFCYNFGTTAYVTTGTDSITVKYSNIGGVAVMTAISSLIIGANSEANVRVNTVSSICPYLPGSDNAAIQIADAASFSFGSIITATINAGGTGYAVNDTGTITSAADTSATYQITSVSAGVVTGFTLTALGTKYAVASGLATARGGAQPGVGTGFTVNVTAVQTGDGNLKIISYYDIIPVP